jgi:hypothetical protein
MTTRVFYWLFSLVLATSYWTVKLLFEISVKFHFRAVENMIYWVQTRFCVYQFWFYFFCLFFRHRIKLNLSCLNFVLLFLNRVKLVSNKYRTISWASYIGHVLGLKLWSALVLYRERLHFKRRRKQLGILIDVRSMQRTLCGVANCLRDFKVVRIPFSYSYLSWRSHALADENLHVKIIDAILRGTLRRTYIIVWSLHLRYFRQSQFWVHLTVVKFAPLNLSLKTLLFLAEISWWNVIPWFMTDNYLWDIPWWWSTITSALTKLWKAVQLLKPRFHF